MKSHQIRFSKFNRPVNRQVPSFFVNKNTSFWGLVSKNPAFFKESHLTALIRVLKFHFKRKSRDGSFFINLKLDYQITKKAIGVRMGKGKGPLADKLFFLRPGFFICAITHDSFWKAHYILLKCIRKLPVCCRIVSFRNW